MHLKQYKLSNVGAMLKHYTREYITKNVDIEKVKDNVYIYNDLYEKYVNGCIDQNKTDIENKQKPSYKVRDKYKNTDNCYNFIVDNINSRVKRKTRADQNIFLDLVIFQPKYLENTKGLNYNKEFFDTMIDTLENKFKWFNKNIFDKKNRVIATIHQDEKGSPHLHYCFMPIYDKELNRKRENKNKKTDKVYNTKDKERLTSDFMNESFLNGFHKEMERLTGYKLTHDDDEKRNLSMPEYQRRQELKKQNEKIHEEIKELEKQIEEKKTNKTELETELKKENDTLKIENEKLKNEIQNKHDTINKYDYYYKTHKNFNIEPPKEEKKIMFQPDNQMLIDRQKQEQFIKEMQQLQFATANDYNKRHTLKEELDKEIAEKEKYLEHIKDKDFCDLKETIKQRESRITDLQSDVSIAESKAKNFETLLNDSKDTISKWKGSYNLVDNQLTNLTKNLLKLTDLTEQQIEKLTKPLDNGYERQ